MFFPPQFLRWELLVKIQRLENVVPAYNSTEWVTLFYKALRVFYRISQVFNLTKQEQDTYCAFLFVPRTISPRKHQIRSSTFFKIFTNCDDISTKFGTVFSFDNQLVGNSSIINSSCIFFDVFEKNSQNISSSFFHTHPSQMSLLQLSILKNSSVLQKDSRVSLILCKQNFCAPVSHARLLCGFSTSKNSDTQDIWVRVQSFRREKSRALPISTRRSFQDLRASFTGIRLSDFGF